MEKDKELTQLEREREELNALINKGVGFEVKDIKIDVEKRFFGLLKKRTKTPIVRKFRIQEPTLATLDRLSAEWIELAIDEEKMKDADALKMARRLIHDHSKRCARIIAIAVLGESLFVPESARCGATKWVEDTAKLNELTDLFIRTIKPSTLRHLCTAIDAMCNLGDFLNSIRLMQTERTTVPIRIEQSKA